MVTSDEVHYVSVEFLVYILVLLPLMLTHVRRLRTSSDEIIPFWRALLSVAIVPIFFAAGFALFHTSSNGLNYYETLGVSRASSFAELRKMYLGKLDEIDVLVQNGLAEDIAAELQNELTRAYKTLLSDTQRQYYHIFGPEAAEFERSSTTVSAGLLGQYFYVYVLWVPFTWVLTWLPGTGGARNYALFLVLLALVLEVSVRLFQYDLSIPVFNKSTPHELLRYLHCALPCLLYIPIFACAVFHIDDRHVRRSILSGLLRRDEMILSNLKTLLPPDYELEKQRVISLALGVDGFEQASK